MAVNNLSEKLKRFADTAGTVFNRALQFTEEKLGSAEKTELDATFESLIANAEKTTIWTEKILKQMEAVLQPNPNIRMEEMFYEKFDRKKRDRSNVHESLGKIMIEAGNELGPGAAYGNALVKAGHTQTLIGNAYREFVTSAANHYLQPLQNFLEGDMKTIMKEKKILETKRLDLDSCKSRLRKAKSSSSNLQAGVDFDVAQRTFDRQAEITKLLLEGITSTHAHHLQCLNDFIEAQLTYHAQCQQHFIELQKQLSSFGDMPSSGAYILFNSSGAVPGSGAGSTSNTLGLGTSSTTTLKPNSSPPGRQVTDSMPAMGKKQARVLYDYDAADPSEISLEADEIITVYQLPDMDPDWIMAEKFSAKGKVPTTYLKISE